MNVKQMYVQDQLLVGVGCKRGKMDQTITIPIPIITRLKNSY